MTSSCEEPEGASGVFRLADFGDELLTRDAAARVCAALRRALDHHERLRIDFAGVRVMAPSFADECFGHIVEELGREVFKARLELTGADAEIRALVNIVLRYRLERRGTDAGPEKPGVR